MKEHGGERPRFLPTDLHTEWDLVVRGPHNLLLVAAPSATSEMLVALKSYLRAPLHEYTPNGGPVPQPPEGTLVLFEVARLNKTQQTQLLHWLDQINERLQVQVVSTSSEPLFPLVQSGAFLADLYYKLNVVLIDLIDVPGRS
jgi:transcriptional regulator of aromatic amino acid metabolism